MPNPGLVVDKNRAPTGPEISSSTGAGVWRKAPKAFPDSSSVLDEFQSAKFVTWNSLWEHARLTIFWSPPQADNRRERIFGFEKAKMERNADKFWTWVLGVNFFWGVGAENLEKQG